MSTPSTASRRVSTSISIMSPPWSAASGPPTAASGAACPSISPRLAPQRLRQRDDTFLARRLLDRLALLAKRSAGDGHRVAVHKPALDQALRQHRDTTRLVQLDRGEAPARLEVAQERRAPADAVDV